VNWYYLKTWIIARTARDERGANLVEYILLVSLIAIVVIVAVAFLGGRVGEKYSEQGSAVESAW